MDFRILGPLEVADDDRRLALGGIKQRSLLAILLQHANEIVSTDHLLAELWGDAPPATAAKSIQVYVSRLRKELGDGRLVTRAPGYVLRVEPSECDLATFERLRAEARRSGPRGGAAKLREALALWRGPPFADLAYERCVQAESARLDELRLAAIEDRIDADLADGRHADLVGELETLIGRHPVRERLRGQVMLALYRSGRQAEALQAYQAARRKLADEFGLEPSGELKRLESAILRQDSTLDLPVQPPGSPGTGERALLVVPSAPERLDGLLALAVPLAAADAPRELVLACIVPAADVGAATAALAARAGELAAHGVVARTAAFASPAPGDDLARLAERQGCDLLLMDAGRVPFDGAARGVLEHAPCDVALLVGSLRPGPVLVPFGAGRHDWAALELGAWVARATGAPLRLVGAASDHRPDGRDASRLLADASLIIQRRSGVVAEPLLTRPGRKGVIGLATDAGLLVVGLPDSWREEGIGRVRTQLVEAPPAPTVLVRRGPAPDAPASTRFTWSLTGSAA